jgi:hypothetical protein
MISSSDGFDLVPLCSRNLCKLVDEELELRTKICLTPKPATFSDFWQGRGWRRLPSAAIVEVTLSQGAH